MDTLSTTRTIHMFALMPTQKKSNIKRSHFSITLTQFRSVLSQRQVHLLLV